MAPDGYPGTPSPEPGALLIEGTAQRYIRAGWKLVGVVFSGGVLAVILKRFGIHLLPKSFSLLEYARLAAFVASSANILVWNWFPQEDLHVLQKWLRSEKHGFPANSSEFVAIILGTVLLLALALSALYSPVWFGAAGTAVYLWNFIGFAHIQRKLRRAAADTNEWLRSLPENKSGAWGEALLCIERFWSCRPQEDRLALPQQARHGMIALAFALDTVLALIGAVTKTDVLGVAAYLVGAAIIVAAEVVIFRWRAGREKSLTGVEDKLRSLGRAEGLRSPFS